MSNKFKKGYALRRMFVDGDLVDAGEPVFAFRKVTPVIWSVSASSRPTRTRRQRQKRRVSQ